MKFFGQPFAASTPAGVLVQAALLALVAAVGWAWPCGDGIARQDRLDAVWFAAAVCLGGIAGSWAAARRTATTPAARVATSLAVVSLRIFPALAALGWLQTTSGNRLRQAGAGEMLVACYMAVLAADVILNMISVRKTARPSDSKIVN